MGIGLSWLGRRLARFLAKPVQVQGTAPALLPEQLLASLQPADVLLIESQSRVSTAIKYLSQSTWSHAALYVGSHLAEAGGNPAHCFIEADVVAGVRSVGVEMFAGLHTRICRAVGLTDDDRRAVANFAIQRLGHRYDLRNVFDLVRYLLPMPPVPSRFRRRLIALGSGDPTRAICSTLIAQAFQSIRYPILPEISFRSADRIDCPDCIEEILRIRHHSLFVPRDFDVSPYFQVIKPTIEAGFDFKALNWEDPPPANCLASPARLAHMRQSSADRPEAEETMPLYAYRCNDCDHEFETLVRSHETPECPACGSAELARQLSLIAKPAGGDEASDAPCAGMGGGGACGGCCSGLGECA
ncbi:MAG: lipo-like protein [Methylocystis sp.]|nr:lipo-like protein [Methylocystis sp.]